MESMLNKIDSDFMESVGSQMSFDKILELSQLPKGLWNINKDFVKPKVIDMCNRLHDPVSPVIFLYGTGVGKTTNAAAILLSYLYWRRNSVAIENLGVYISTLELFRHNAGGWNDTWLKDTMDHIYQCECVVIDGAYSRMSRTDDMLLQEILDKRQYCEGITVFTAAVDDVLKCDGRSLARIAGSTLWKVHF